MSLQTDCKFQQANIKKLKKEFDVDMNSTNLRGGKNLRLNKKSVNCKNCC